MDSVASFWPMITQWFENNEMVTVCLIAFPHSLNNDL